MIALRLMWAVGALSLAASCEIGQQRNAQPTITSTLTTSKGGLVPGDAQSVTIHLALTDGGFGSEADQQRVWTLEDQLIQSISEAGVGTFDGDGFGDGGADLFAYGPDADALWAAMEDDVRSYGPAPGSSVVLVYGTEANAEERTIQLP